MNVFLNSMGSLFIPDGDLISPMGPYASSPSESHPRAMRGDVTGMADALSTVGVHEHHQHADVTP